MEATLEGYGWLPRMIDKAAAARAGTLGTFTHPCPVDRRCLDLLGVGAREFGDIVERCATDAEVLSALRARGIPSAEEAHFDPVAFEDALIAGAGVPVRVVRTDALPFTTIANELMGHEHGSELTVLVVEAAPGKGPGLHTHPYEEILVVLEGEATFDLGGETRIVRAGEIVIVPAGRPHGFVNSGAGPLRQIDIHASPSFSTEWL